MKRLLTAALVAWMVLVLGGANPAVAAGTVVAPRAVYPVNIDGSLSDSVWKYADPLVIDDLNVPDWITPGTFVVEGEKLSGPGDASLRAYFLWDEQYLYIGLDVTDDQLVTDRLTGMLEDQDSVELVFDPARKGYQRTPLLFAPNTATKNGPWFSLPGSLLAIAVRKGGTVGQIKPLGYSAEIAIPRGAFQRAYGVDLVPSSLFGLEVRLNDVDLRVPAGKPDAEPSRSLTRLAWTGEKPVIDWQKQPKYGQLLLDPKRTLQP